MWYFVIIDAKHCIDLSSVIGAGFVCWQCRFTDGMRPVLN